MVSSNPEPLNTVLSSAFTLTIFSQHRAGARRRVYRSEDGAKEQRAELEWREEK